MNQVKRSFPRWGRVGVALALALAALPVVLLSSSSPVAAGPAPVFTMFVPFEDQQVVDALRSIANLADGSVFDDSVTTIDITSAADNSVIYWDHWEDGYEADIANPVQSTTQVWGDNNAGNGSAPGAATDDVDSGTVIYLNNTVPLPRDSNDVVYDGRDKVASTRGFAMTRAGWSVYADTLHAGAVAATDLSKWGTQFDFPVGENIGVPAFDYTGVGVLASDDNTFVQVDTNGDGSYDATDTLDEGETMFIDGGVSAGGSVQTSKPAQTHLITGRRGSNYEGRWFEVFPEEIRGDEYVAAAGSTSDSERVTIFLQNPGDTAITVNVDAEGVAFDTDIVIEPSAVAYYDLPNQSGARFSSPGNPFSAVSGTVARVGSTQAYDWGYGLVPTSSLTPGVVVGWGKGNPSGDSNHNRIWVAPLDNIKTDDIEIYADFDGDGNSDLIDTNGDGTPDAPFVTARAFESVAFADVTDNDATGARIYTVDGTLLSVAWGQDPADGECCDAYDLGTPVLPSTALVTTKSHRLVVDLNGDGNVNPGDTLEYTIRSVDAGALALTNINIVDTLPSTLTYVPDSTSMTFLPEPAVPQSGPVSDEATGSTIFPVDEDGIDVAVLQAGAAVEVTFRAQLVDPFPLFVQNVRNDVNATSDQGKSTATSIVPVVIPDLYIAKSAPTTPVVPGQSFDYTIDVSNVSLAPQTGIDVTDILPSEVSWNSTTVVRPIDDPAPGGSLTTTDRFNTPAYDNNSADWTTNWIEGGDDGSAGSGDVRVISELGSNRLRIRAANNQIRRTFDATNWDKAFVNFDWRRGSFESSDSVSFQISTTGGSSWIELDSFNGPADDAGYSNISYDLTHYVGHPISMRFVSSSGMSNGDEFFFDDFELVLGRRVLETVAGNAPAALYTDGDLLTGENLTVTVNVTVDDSIDPTTDDFTNTASAMSAQNASPVVSSATVDVARASIGDTVWHDVDGDGIVDASEPTLSGVEVTLSNSGGVVATDITDGSGNYSFADLDPGDYTVAVTSGIPSGMAATDDADGGQDGTTDVTVDFDEDNTSIDFGYATPVSIGDRVFADIDGNGTEEPPSAGHDLGIDGIDVTITGTSANASYPSGTTIATTNGDYLFTGLLPGTYDVTVDTSSLSTAAYSTTGGSTQTHVVTSGTDQLDADFGYVLPATLGDLVWHDLDADGTYDPGDGETPFAGVTVTLDRTDATAPTQTRVTDANGYYMFVDLDAGVYDVTVSTGTGNLPSGYDSSTGGATQSVSLLVDDMVDTADFGFYTQASIGDFVYDDLNGNGVWDANGPGLADDEPGIEGLTVTIDDGTTTATTTTGTGANAGSYDFTGLEPGTYTVTVDESGFASGTVASENGATPDITVRSADDIDTADFGYVFPSSVGDLVFHDLNGNGVRDLNGPGTADDEPGIDGVTLTLSSSVLGADLTTTTMDGAYLFSGLEPGTYTVTLDEATLPSGYAISAGGSNTSTVSLVSGTSELDVDFGAHTTADIGDLIFHDLDADGVWESGEPALDGVLVTLTGANASGPITPITDTTDVDGLYLFPDLEPGSYTVTVDPSTLPVGYVVTAGDDTRSTTLESGTDDLDLDFGYATTTSIGDLVWDDLDGDRTQNDGAASGIAGVDVTIVGTSPGASHQTGETIQTAADGSYLFEGLAPGTYEVSISMTGPLAGSMNSVGGTTQTVTVVSATPDTDVDFGVYFPGSIGDTVFDDANGDGTLDLPDDAGIDGVRVTLTGTTVDGAITPVIVTTVDGDYGFTGLAPGDYVVTLTSSDLPADVVNTIGGTSSAVTIASGQDDDSVDFGFFVPSTLGDLVFDDADGDGTFDAGDDSGIDGVTITLYSGSSAAPGNELDTDVTAAGGAYEFTGLAPGTYTVEIETADLVSGADITTSGGSTTMTTTLTSGNDDRSLDFGVANPISIGDLVFEDLNGDGVHQVGEPALSDATGITLTVDAGSPTSTTDGTYLFSDLLPGSHVVAVDVATVPAGWSESSPTSVTRTYRSGDAVDDVDFGFTRPATIGDLVFDDLDGDGVRDLNGPGTADDEPGLAGVTLELSGPGVAPGTTATTLADGAYSFDGLAPGTYTVTVVTVPAGYSNTLGGTSRTTTVESNETDSSLDFGFYLGASIGDLVFTDVDGDGSFGAGDTGLGGVTVTLYSGSTTDSANVVATRTTASDGAYDFGGLDAGTYTVAVTDGLPADAVNTVGAPSSTFTVVSGDDENGADFGYFTPASIGDYVWDDLDGDGDPSGETPATDGLDGVTVSLYTGTSTDASDLVSTVETGSSGDYAFTGIAPGTYTVAIDPADLAVGAMSTTGGFVVDTILVESGDTIDSVDFGVAAPSSIGDLVFADNDGSADLSVGDANLDGVTVTLTGGNLPTSGPGSSLVDTTGTDGIYGFSGLYPGTYTVTVTPTGDLSGDEMSTTGGSVQTVVVTSGTVIDTVDFGYAEPASIGDTVFVDVDGDSTQDLPEDTGIADVDVTITGTTSGASHPGGFTIQTGPTGAYAFTGLRPGSYTVEVDTSDPDLDAAYASTTGGDSAVRAIVGGLVIDDVDFGYAAPGTIGDFVFTDPNGDGDPSDAVALGGVSLELRDALGGLAGTATSDATTGAYSFTGVVPGDYTVVVVGGLPTDAFSTTGGDSIAVTVTSGSTIDTADFGYAQPATIGDQVYVDDDASGSFDAGDTGYTATVTITGTSPGASHPGGETFPAPAGVYSISGLRPGTYDLVVSGLPSGAAATEGLGGHTITVTSGATDNSADFGFWLPATIGDEVFEDMNGDGDRDLDDTGLAGVELTITGPSHPTGTSVTTDGTGDYSFDSLAPGSYTITVTAAPSGAVNTLGGTSRTITVTSGETDGSADFGFTVPGSLGDLVWDDLNGDGVQNDGPASTVGIAGITVTLTGTTASGPIAATTAVTDSDGAYTFGSLAPGTYEVAITDGLDPADRSTTGGTTISSIVVTSGETVDSIDFGIAHPASIGDRVFQDVDGDGTEDAPDDTGFDSVTITVVGTSANADHQGVGTTVTTGSGTTSGDYLVSGLFPGTYEITVVPGTGNLPADAASSTGGTTRTVTVASGDVVDTADFGHTLPASIGDQLFIDNDANGVYDNDDVALAGVDVILTGPGQPVGGTVQETAANGIYDFTDLTPGTYTVSVDVTDPEFVAIFGSGAASTAISSTGGNSRSVTITSTEHHDAADFGYYALGSIGDFVFEDADGDGTADPVDDLGLENVTITLTGGDLPVGGVTTTTGTAAGGDAGEYLFDALTPGEYTVTATVTGMSPTTSTTLDVTVLSGGVIDDADFGAAALGSIGDLLFDDLDGDGIRDAGEPGLENVTVTLTGGDLPTAGITTTTGTTAGGDAGEYSFTGLMPGIYDVTVSTAELPDPAYASTTGGDSRTVTLTSGATDDSVDFGYVAPGSVGDLVFDDLDGDGTHDVGEPGYENVVLRITGGDLPAAGLTTTTGTGPTAGEYGFTGLAPGTYTVEIVSGLPTGAVSTLGDGGTTVTITSGDIRDDVDFGAYVPISLGDLVFIDENGNGTFNGASGDTVLDGVEITLSGPALAADLTTTTNPSGVYGFSSLAPGTYTIALTGGVPADHLSTTGGNSITLTVTSGDSRDDLDFGLAAPITIGDRVWHDQDASATDDAEPGLGGVTLELVDGSGLVVDTTVTSTTVGSVGAYTFTNVIPAPLDYTVRVVTSSVPAGYGPTTAESVAVTATSGDDVSTADFGYVTTSSIAGHVWEDDDGDGSDDGAPTEVGLGGLTVTLTGGNLPPAGITTTTDPDGDYSFPGLPPGDYTVTVTGPTGATATSSPGEVMATTLLSGIPVTDLDVGYAFGASIGDLVWHDLDASGTHATGEPGLAGVEVLLSGNGVGLSDTTDGLGAYLFTGLAPGEYTITFDPTTVPVGAASGAQLTATTPVTFTVTVTSGEIRDDLDLGFTTTASIGDTIFDDLDGDGVLDLLEPGIGSVDVELLDAGGTVVGSTTTDSTGNYLFTGLAPGTYTVRVDTATLPAGAGQTTPSAAATVTVVSDARALDVDLGFARPASIGDRIWHDLDADGIADTGDPGLGGITVNLFDSSLAIVGTATTDPSGSYTITGIEPGTYTVQVDTATVPAGTNSSVPMTASTGLPTSIGRTVASGDVVTDADFAFHTTASIGDLVWHDRDGSGDFGGPDGSQTDAWLDAVVVNLVDPVSGGVVQTVTSTDGAYRFDGVSPGTYRVEVDAATIPTGYSSTTGNSPSTVTVTSDAVVDTVDIGYAALTGGAIGNEVFDDLDGDGTQDAGEPGLDVTVELWQAGSLVSTRSTAGGGYNFVNLAPGTYDVRVVTSSVPAGYSSTTTGSNVTDNGNTRTYTILSGAAPITTADFGYAAMATVGDMVWHDLDADGLLTAADGPTPGLAGITVELRDGTTVVDSAVTGSDGRYLLTARPGTYDVVIVDSTVPNGSNSGVAMAPTTATSFPVTLTSNEARTDIDVGFATTARIGDTIFDDLDGDGVQQPGEPGLESVTVVLTDGASGTVDVVTGADGSYEFVGVAPGTYTVSADPASVPSGYAATTSSTPLNVSVVSDDAVDDVDLGFTMPGTIGGIVWLDANGNGLQTGESGDGIAVDVELLDAADAVVATVTTVDGTYLFTDVAPGDYSVRPVIDASSRITRPDVGSDDDLDSDVVPATGRTGTVTIISGSRIDHVDAGVFELATIGDTVFADLDDDGVQDADEPGIAGVDVTVRDGDGAVSGSATTDASGRYSVDVVPGTHTVSIVVPDGYAGGANGTSSVVTLASGVTDDSVDFPLVGTGRLVGSTIYDVDNDGTLDVTDPGLASVTVTATWDGPAGPVEFTTTTGPDGSYEFVGLPPGDHDVSVDPATLPDGIVAPTVDPDSTIDLSTVVTVTGGPVSGIDFGVSGTARLGDEVFLDANENGVLDEGERGVSGVVVTASVTTADGDRTYRTVTDANGNYEFANLPAGDYTVTIDVATVPSGMVPTLETVSTTLAIDGSDDTMDLPLVLVDGPVAIDDSVTTTPATPVVVSVMSNDSVPTGVTTNVTDATTPDHGVVVTNGGGTITYTPDDDFEGTDSFEYTICDLVGLVAAGDTAANRAIFCSTATVTVVVVAPPDEDPSTERDPDVTPDTTVPPDDSVPPTTQPPSDTGTPTTGTPDDGSTESGRRIPRTGSESAPMSTIAVSLLLFGLVLWFAGRRRKDGQPPTRSNAWPAPQP